MELPFQPTPRQGKQSGGPTRLYRVTPVAVSCSLNPSLHLQSRSYLEQTVCSLLFIQHKQYNVCILPSSSPPPAYPYPRFACAALTFQCNQTCGYPFCFIRQLLFDLSIPGAQDGVLSWKVSISCSLSSCLCQALRHPDKARVAINDQPGWLARIKNSFSHSQCILGRPIYEPRTSPAATYGSSSAHHCTVEPKCGYIVQPNDLELAEHSNIVYIS